VDWTGKAATTATSVRALVLTTAINHAEASV